MQKKNIIPEIVFEILKFKKCCNLICGEHFGLQLWEADFSSYIQFSQNHIGNYGTSFKAWKVMLPSLKCQTFHFGSKLVLFTQLSRQQTQFSKLSLCHFLVYMAKYYHTKNFKNSISRSWGKCIPDRWTGREMDRWTKLTLYHKVGGSIMFFGNSRIKFGNNKYKKKEYNQHSSMFKEFKNNDP